MNNLLYKEKLIHKNYNIFGLFLILFFIFIKYFNPENAFVEAHDNLDSLYVYWSLLPKYKYEYFQLIEYFKIRTRCTLILCIPWFKYWRIIFFFFKPNLCLHNK